MKKLAFIFLLVLFQLEPGYSQKIFRVAGDSLAMPGFSGDGSLALNSKLSTPTSVSTDSVGNIYILDNSNNRIRKIAKTSGIISTVAGGGSAQPANGDTATKISLLSLGSMTADQSGDLYLSDVNVILRVDAITNTINLIAGSYSGGGFSGDSGLAIGALLLDPRGIHLDETRNYLYFADQGNHRARKIDLNTGIITTIAGTGIQGSGGDGGSALNAQLNSPMAAISDSSGNIYITDASCRIRRIDKTSGIITTFAGTTQGYGGDNGPALSASFDGPVDLSFDHDYKNLYVADANNSMIRKINVATDTIQRVCGMGIADYTGDGGQAIYASLSNPNGVHVSDNNEIYIGDTDNNLIRKIKPKILGPYHQFPDSNAIWNFGYNNYNGCALLNDYFSTLITGDTILGGATYQKLNVPYVSIANTSCVQTWAGYKGAIREDTSARKVYYIPPGSNTEYLLYDFTMEVGDTVHGYLEEWLGTSADLVHSIDSVVVGNSYRKRWHINYSYGIYLIEGVGSTFGLIYHSLGEVADGGHYFLTCFIQDSISQYPSSGAPCQLITSIKNFNDNVVIPTVFPNPVSGNLYIENINGLRNVKISDVVGQVMIHATEFAGFIDVSSLSKGIYLLRGESASGIIAVKFIKE